MANTPLISCEHVTKQFESNEGRVIYCLKDINAQIYSGEILGIVGESGSGKTTLLKLLAGLIEPTSGSIWYRSQTTIASARAEGCIGYVPQSLSLLPFRSVFENIHLPLELQHSPNPNRVKELIALCGLEGFEHYLPHQLSGGMKQKVAIARALSIQPQVLIMDEPFAALDEMMKEVLNDEVLKIQSVLGTTIIYVTHNIEEAVFLSNRIVVLSKQQNTIAETVSINLPEQRDVNLRTNSQFFDEVTKLRLRIKNV